MVVKYEDFLESPKENLGRLVELINIKLSEDDLDKVVTKTSKEEIRKSVEKGGEAITNIYLGNKKDYDWAKGYAQERLSEIIDKHDYA
jgi:hypothetical protein